MIKNEKAMTAEDRIIAAVSDIKNIKDRKGTASNDAVRVILNKWWIPSNSKIANCLKEWSSSITPTPKRDISVANIANSLIVRTANVHDCYKCDILHEIPSNGFRLPSDAGELLLKYVYFRSLTNDSEVDTAQVIGIEYYGDEGFIISLKSDSGVIELFETDIFLNESDCKNCKFFVG